jgi:hypothetical protein
MQGLTIWLRFWADGGLLVFDAGAGAPLPPPPADWGWPP